MKPKPNQDVARPNAVSPVFSGALPLSVLSAPPKDNRFNFNDEDRKAVEDVLTQDPFPDDDET